MKKFFLSNILISNFLIFLIDTIEMKAKEKRIIIPNCFKTNKVGFRICLKTLWLSIPVLPNAYLIVSRLFS